MAQIPLEAIPGIGDDHWLKKLGRDSWPAFCTQRLDGKSAAIHLNGLGENIKGLCQEVAHWDGLSNAIALDENIAHVDRHLNNLIRLGKRRFAMIDNGRLINEYADFWDTSMLEPTRLYSNKLSYAACKDEPPEGMATQILQVAHQHEQSGLQAIREELEFWFTHLLPKEEREAFSDFLDKRTEELTWLLRKRYKILI